MTKFFIVEEGRVGVNNWSSPLVDLSRVGMNLVWQQFTFVYFGNIANSLKMYFGKMVSDSTKGEFLVKKY